MVFKLLLRLLPEVKGLGFLHGLRTKRRTQTQIPLTNLARLLFGRMQVVAAVFIAMGLMVREKKKMKFPEVCRPQKQACQPEI